MRVIKALSIVVVLLGLAALAVAYAPSVYGQREERHDRRLTMLPGRGASIGVSVRDVDGGDTAKAAAPGVVVDDVRPDSPAEKAGLKRADVITEFDGERVRSARQFARLVEETPANRTVNASVLRDGRRVDVHITPEMRSSELWIDEDRLRDRLGDLEGFAERLPYAFDFDFDFGHARGRLGVTVQNLTPQLAAYFGAKDGVLVAAVTEGSPAEAAGIKAGDVITAVNGERVTSRADLTRRLGDSSEVSVTVMRDRKELVLKATLDRPTKRPVTSRPA
jgi:serine protease Do